MRSRDPHAATTRPAILAGRYELVSEIGRGGCAVIYEARDIRLGRAVAVKVLRPGVTDGAAHARLQREARAASLIHHPNVCAILDAGSLDDGRPYLVMERLHGETLTTLAQRVGALAPEDAVDLAVQLLSALDTVHAAGVVHRDVKPDNIFIVPRTGCSPLLKLLDFGMCRSRTVTTVRDDATLTRAGHVVGTPEYMAPEQVRGKREFDARIDLYAVGVIVYECLSGRRAFFGGTVREVVLSVLARPLPALRSIRPEVPLILDRIVARAMERERSFRYRTAGEFITDLLEAKNVLARRRVREEQGSYVGELPREDEWDMPTRQLYSSRRAGGMA